MCVFGTEHLMRIRRHQHKSFSRQIPRRLCRTYGKAQTDKQQKKDGDKPKNLIIQINHLPYLNNMQAVIEIILL